MSMELDFVAPRPDVLDIDIRFVVEIVQIGDFLRRRREAGCQHKVEPAGQIFVVVAVLIHDRQPLDPVRLRAGLGDIDDLRVEIAGVAGKLFINAVGDHMREPPEPVRISVSFTPAEDAPVDHIPQDEFDLKLAVIVLDRRSDQESFCAKRQPVGEIRLHRR